MTDASATPSTPSAAIAAELDRKIAGTEPLLDVVRWYQREVSLAKNSSSSRDEKLVLDMRHPTANEMAAQNLGLEDYQSEDEIVTRRCGCEREDPNVCECFAWLQAARAAPVHAPVHEEAVSTIGEVERALSGMAREALRARGAKTVPQHFGLWTTMLFLAPRGNELAQDTLAQILRARPDHDPDHDVTPVNERILQDRLYITLLYAAFDAHPDYADARRAVPRAILRWRLAGTVVATTESARLVDWFCATHPMQALRIERDLRLKMRKQGWRV
jgi:hypothetical protein